MSQPDFWEEIHLKVRIIKEYFKIDCYFVLIHSNLFVKLVRILTSIRRRFFMR